MIQAHSRAYRPPIPVLEITLSAPDRNDWHRPFLAIVDSGADATIVPFTIIDEIRSEIVRPAVLSSQWRDRRSVNIYEVDLQLDTLIFYALEVAGDRQSNEIILGRNFLNLIDLRLNGPALQVELTTRRRRRRN